jgi:hypothetical protein
MTYLGNTPTTQSFISGTDYFNGTGSQTAFTLSRSVGSINDIQVTVNNVVQQPNDAYTLSGTTLTMTSAPSAGTNNVYVRYLSTTTQSITPSQNTVSWNTLDTNTQQDLGISNKNRLINGDMTISQRNGTSSITPTADDTFTLDRWAARISAASKLSFQQNAGSVTPPAGFTNYLGATSLSAYSVSSTDYFAITQGIEGFNTADLNWGTANAKTITLSFWVRSSLTGTFSGALLNDTRDRVYPFTYTISAANTWELETITIAGDTSGTWTTNNSAGIYARFCLGAGSTRLATAGSWQTTAGAIFGATGTTSVVGTNGATFYITGVQLEVGTQATTFTTAGGSYGAELALCQRYCNVYGENIYSVFGTWGWAFSTTGFASLTPLPVEMRAVPTLSYSGNTRGINGSETYAVTSAVFNTSNSSKKIVVVEPAVASGLTVNRGYAWASNNDSTARVIFSAEL